MRKKRKKENKKKKKGEREVATISSRVLAERLVSRGEEEKGGEGGKLNEVSVHPSSFAIFF